MSDFGEELRRERESRGVGLETITRVTKIGSRYLRALEEEQFDALPGGVFNKNIVRGYARVVGLDEEEWVRRFISAYRSSNFYIDEENGWMQFAENTSKGREASQGRRPDMRLRWAGIVVLLLAVAGLSWFAWSYVHRKILLETRHRATQNAPSSLPLGQSAYASR
jgi:cytoskeletal protein RodZ